MARFSGPFLIVIFCLSQAFRDVYFGHLFQGVDFFLVILLAFLLSAAIFGLVTAIRSRAAFRKMRAHLPMVIGMNVTTAIAWTCYFFALSHLEPAVVNTLHSGMAPLTVIGLGAFGLRLAKHKPVGTIEAAAYAGIALSLAALWWVVLSGRSGIPVAHNGAVLASLMLLLVSGTSITVSLLYSKRLHDHGIGADAVTSVRYLLIIAIAAGIEAFGDRPMGVGSIGDLAFLAVAATVLISLPLYALQAGTARTAPLTAQIIRASGPVFVFALEPFDHRLSYSGPVLVCILAYSLCTILGNLAHGWRDFARTAAPKTPGIAKAGP